MDADTKEQYVCQVCGYNMVGYLPDNCPFCGASKQKFYSCDENSARRRVNSSRVNDRVTRLNSVPELGYEHAAYRVEAEKNVFMIDCPSTYDQSVPQIDTIFFTHHHFLGASNLYRSLYPARVVIHKDDSNHDMCRGFPFDTLFSGSFTENDLSAVHLGGHTPGFTCYFFGDVLFICDYVIKEHGKWSINPYGPENETRSGLKKLLSLLIERPVKTVCGVDYVMSFPSWNAKVRPLIE
ncbi:MAG: rubredoxin-like domain-containing protein [Methanoregulaceae archaeon]